MIGSAAPDARKGFRRGLSLAGDAVVLADGGLPLRLELDPSAGPDGFRIQAECKKITVFAADAPGFQYAGTALGEWLARNNMELLPWSTEQKPVFARRGVMLDISRDKVPTMDTLFALAEQLAAWRINHLQLYTEHTFAYPGHEEIWQDASPMTADEVRRLDRHCAELHIELAPNQNSLGHLHRWLKHPNYLHLAECPDGFVTPWGERRSEPFSLNPEDPRSLELVAGWYDGLLPHFTSPLFNVGCDEAFDLGQGASADACAARGKGRVYLDYLLKIKRLVEERGKTMMFWADIILKYPDLVPELGKDVVALAWGYEADHPFDAECRCLAASGVPFWVCPGTSNWCSITGRFENAMGNLQAAADAGRTHGADGYLITEWGDCGHWQTMPFMLAMLAAGAQTAWSGQIPSSDQLDEMIDDGPVIRELGQVYRDAGFNTVNASPIFPLVHRQNPEKVLERWTETSLSHALEHVQTAVGGLTQPKAADGSEQALRQDEIRLGASMLDYGLRRGLWIKGGRSVGDAGGLTDALMNIRGELSRLWLLRNRPGGLRESLAPLDQRLASDAHTG